jgi:ATP-dependent helicase/nuclease subunit B
MLVDKIIGQLRQDGHPFLARLNPGTGIAQAFYATIDSIRPAGLGGADLAVRHFEDSGRAEAMRAVLNEYISRCLSSGLIDYTELLQIAQLETVTDALLGDALLLVPQDAALGNLEKRLLAIPGEKLRRLAVDEPASQGSSAETDTDLLRWILQPSDAPPPASRKTVQIIQAIGEVNEVRQIFRQCLAAEAKLDDVEVLHTDFNTYVPLIYETMMSVIGDGETSGEDLPVTFAEGIPAIYSRPGRALLTWIEWIANDYPQASLWKMLRDGLLEVNTEKENASFGQLASLFRQLPIQFGRPRYLEKLTHYRQNLEDQRQVQTAQLDDEGDARCCLSTGRRTLRKLT